MVTIEHVETRADLAEAMAHLRELQREHNRRGHEGQHKSCQACDKYDRINDEINFLLVAWQAAT